MKIRIMLVALVALIAAGSAQAIDLTLDATGDTHMRGRSDLADLNFGRNEANGAWSGAGGDAQRILVGFDTSSLVGANSITGAILRVELHASYGGSSGAPRNNEMAIHRLTQSFVQGTGSHEPTNDGATWNSYDYGTHGDGSSALAWPGGGGALGDAVQDDPNFTAPPTAFGTTGFFLDIDVTASVLQAVAGQPHHGFVISHAVEGSGDNWTWIHAGESTVGATAAQLIPVPEPATLGLMGLASLCMLRRRR